MKIGNIEFDGYRMIPLIGAPLAFLAVAASVVLLFPAPAGSAPQARKAQPRVMVAAERKLGGAALVPHKDNEQARR